MDPSSGEDQQVAVLVASMAAMARRRARARATRTGVRRRRIGGSVRGRRPNRARDFEAGLTCILRDYFGRDGAEPVYGEADFERRFRVSRAVFVRVYDAIRVEPFWQQRVNATGRPQAHPLQKLVGAFRVLAYGEAADRPDEYVRLSRTTVAEATRRLVAFLIDTYADTYLRPPNEAEAAAILQRNAARGAPGCLGSIDCSHWEWAACPKALAGQYQGRDGKRTVTMETICDEDLYIWHLFVGVPGSNNDTGVLSLSPLYRDVAAGRWPPRQHSYTINGRTRTLPFYLADGIYPKWALFATPCPNPDTPAKKTYNRLQVALRKDVERLYAVLRARFHVLLHPARFFSVDRLIDTTMAVAILHNLMVLDRRGTFLGRRRMEEAAAVAGGSAAALGGAGVAQLPHHDVEGPAAIAGAPPPDLSYLEARLACAEVTDRTGHFTLRDDLAAHMHAEHGAPLQPYL